MQETTGAPSLPGRNGDMPRVPDMLNQLPDERDFQPTNPSVTNNASSDGAVVAKPPSSTPPRNKGENPQP